MYTASCDKKNIERSLQTMWNGTLWFALSEISGIRRRYQENDKNSDCIDSALVYI